jgi:formate-dependent nitrite reductase membrane component NrfD
MTELVTTAHSPIAQPYLHAWAWEIPLYLFLGGWTAGILVLSGIALWRGRVAPRRGGSFALTSSGPALLGLAAISLGMLCLLLDLTHKLYVWRVYTTFEPSSPMSWGSWILILVYPVLALGVLLDPPRVLAERVPIVRSLAEFLASNRRARKALGVTGVVAGIALGIYTGILLSALGARPLWSSAVLGPLFLASGLSTAAAFGHLVAPDPMEREELARMDNVFLVAELALLALLLVGLVSSTRAQAEAAALFLGGPYTAVFWVGVVGLGIAIPVLVQSLAVGHRIAHTPVAPLLVMAGGLVLRFVIVSAGQFSHWPRM